MNQSCLIWLRQYRLGGKILDARSRDVEIPDTWAVDEKKASQRLILMKYEVYCRFQDQKGYGLMMMVDVLAGSLLGFTFWQNMSAPCMRI